MSDLPADKFGRTVVLVSDALMDNYTVTDMMGQVFIFSFPLGTDLAQVYATINANESVPDLATAKAQKLSSFQAAVEQYVEDRYPFKTRVQFMNLYILAKFQSLPDRAAYIEAGLNWVNSVIAYSVQFMALVQAQTLATDVLALTWDIDTNVTADPKLRIGQAISIQT